MKANHPKLRIPADIQDLYECGPLEETVAFRVLDRSCGSRRLEYATNGPRDYYLWDVTRQNRVESWRTAAEMWEHARERLQPYDMEAEAD